MKQFKILLLALLTVFFTACGGSSSSGGDPGPDITPTGILLNISDLMIDIANPKTFSLNSTIDPNMQNFIWTTEIEVEIIEDDGDEFTIIPSAINSYIGMSRINNLKGSQYWNMKLSDYLIRASNVVGPMQNIGLDFSSEDIIAGKQIIKSVYTSQAMGDESLVIIEFYLNEQLLGSTEAYEAFDKFDAIQFKNVGGPTSIAIKKLYFETTD